MGVWGTGILDDDAAVDVYGLYIDQYNLGMSVEEIRAYLNPRCGTFTRGTSALQPDEVPIFAGQCNIDRPMRPGSPPTFCALCSDTAFILVQISGSAFPS